ncbi:MAG TPA: hypothetical protein VFT65_18040 [Candidatus Angelobacter sp.]|nr:hypothetical protein [Candidatus Angelobacter sp.]
MAHFFILVLEAIFFVGLAGSMVVAILAFVGDIHEFFEKDLPEGSTSQAIGD